MVLVRKTELACRHGWDHDLWEPRESGKGSAPGQTTAGSSRKATRSASRVAAGGNAAGRVAAGADSLVEIDSTNGASRNQSTDSVPDADRATYRNDSAMKAWSSSLAAEGPSSFDGVDQLQYESVVSRFGATRGDWHGRLEHYREQRAAPAEPVPAPPVLNRDSDDASWRVNNRNEALETHNQAEPESLNGHVHQSGLTEQFNVETNHSTPNGAAHGVEQVDNDPGMSDTNEHEDDPPASVEIPMLQASNACCRNCRDFLPAKDGWTGWCANPFAFEKRKEVSGDTVACQSSFGSWWSPSDDWWMERADIAHHSAPTPLVDNLIRQIRIRQLDEEGSTEGQVRS